MKFKINDREWIIKEVSQEEFWRDEGLEEKIGTPEYNTTYHFGRCLYKTQEIWIWKDISKEQKRKTLYHELMHCYIYCYLCDGIQFDEEGLCNISAKSHDMIHKIVEKFLEGGNND